MNVFASVADVGAPMAILLHVYNIFGQIGSNSAPLLISIYVWESPTVQNRQLPLCSKSRLYLYATDCSLTVEHPHKRYPNSATSWNSSDHWLARGLAATIHEYASSKCTSVLLAMSQPASPEIATIAIARQSQPHSQLEKQICCETTPPAGHDRRLARLHQAAAARKTTARQHRRTPSHASQLAATRSPPPGIQQARPAWNKTALFRATFSPACYERKFTTATTSWS
jgi:hypothetical protein